MLVSIIIPVYNVAPYIEKCLQSVMDQTYTGSMECLLVDDCGQDDSMAIAEQCIEEYKAENSQNSIDFRIIRHTKNRGLSAARNTGIDNAQGEWLYFLDSDDWIIPECIDLMMQRVKQYSETEAVFAGTKVINGCHEWADYESRALPEYSEDCHWINSTLLKRNVLGMTAWNKLLKRQIIDNYNLRFIEGLTHEDEVWNMQLSYALRHMCILNRNTYHYLTRDSGIMGKTLTDKERFNRLFLLFNIMTNCINGERWQEQSQVKMIASWSIRTSIRYWDSINIRRMSFLLTKLAFKAKSFLSAIILIQASLALCKSRYYNNRRLLRYLSLE